MTIVRCGLIDCANNSCGMCAAPFVFLKHYAYEGLGCDTFESKESKKEGDREIVSQGETP